MIYIEEFDFVGVGFVSGSVEFYKLSNSTKVTSVKVNSGEAYVNNLVYDKSKRILYVIAETGHLSLCKFFKKELR